MFLSSGYEYVGDERELLSGDEHDINGEGYQPFRIIRVLRSTSDEPFKKSFDIGQIRMLTSNPSFMRIL